MPATANIYILKFFLSWITLWFYIQFFYVSAAAKIISWKRPFKTEDDAKVLHLELRCFCPTSFFSGCEWLLNFSFKSESTRSPKSAQIRALRKKLTFIQVFNIKCCELCSLKGSLFPFGLQYTILCVCVCFVLFLVRFHRKHVNCICVSSCKSPSAVYGDVDRVLWDFGFLSASLSTKPQGGKKSRARGVINNLSCNVEICPPWSFSVDRKVGPCLSTVLKRENPDRQRDVLTDGWRRWRRTSRVGGILQVFAKQSVAAALQR